MKKGENQMEQFRQRAIELVEQMSLEEKVSQTLYTAPAIERLGIKAYNWWNEALHGVARAGVATVFPQAIGLAATFDEAFVEKVADAISTEGRGKFNMQQQFNDTDIYKGLTFWSPNVNIFRDPRWGRGHETFGEDPYLSSRLGVGFVQGIQGHHPKYMKAAACAKHFAVHSGPESLRHSFNAIVSKKDMYETYLPAFKACVQEGHVEAVMGAYNRVNDEPCCGSPTLLQDILRDEWGFEGHVVSDCWAISDFHSYHHITKNAVESVTMAMNNGCDLNCGKLFMYLEQAVKEGKVDEKKLDEAVIRLFTTRMKLGLFDNDEALEFNAIPYSQVDSQPMRALNIEAAEKSAVLLKNEKNTLPLCLEKIKTIGVIGPNANNRKALVGNYEGTASRYVTVLEGIQDYVLEEARVFYSEGCHLYKESLSELAEKNDRLAEVKGVCAESDVVIVCLGLDAGLEGEEGDQGNQYASGDKETLDLPGHQEAILKAAVESGKPVILVVLSGSALAINYAQEHVPAIIQGWYPGAEGGTALARLIFGDVSPQGRLPVTFYKTTEELPDFVDYEMKNRTYRYMTTEPLYPFGYGLSYTKFHYSEVKCSTDKITKDGITLNGKIENIGRYSGTETVQVYVKALMDGAPNCQLKGIQKIALQPGEKRDIEIHLPWEAFALYDEHGKQKVYNVTYEISFGGYQPDKRSQQLSGMEGTKFNVTVL